MPNEPRFLGFTENAEQFVVRLDTESGDPNRMLAVKQLGDDLGVYDARTGVLVLFVPVATLRREVDMAKVEPYRREMVRMQLEWGLARSDEPPDPDVLREIGMLYMVAQREFVTRYAVEVSAALGRIMDAEAEDGD